MSASNSGVDRSVDQAEIEHFDRHGDDWWDERGKFAALHRLTPARVCYVRRQLVRLRPDRASAATAEKPLAGLSVVDIGCGGGILAEPLARLGAAVTGIDLSAQAIEAATAHAAAMGLDICYRRLDAARLAKEGERFDLIIASEVIEHVADRSAFLAALAALGHQKAPLSLVIVTTINRNPVSVVMAKYAAEYLLRLAPVGTHDAHKFVTPAELRREAAAHGIDMDDVTGIRPDLMQGFALGGPPLINYAAAGLVSVTADWRG